MVSKRQQRIARQKHNIGVRRKQLERLSRQERERIAWDILPARQNRDYVNYDCDLQHLKKSLGIDVAAEIQRLKCKNVLDLGCGKATALSQLETIPGTNFFGLNFTQEPKFSKLKNARVKIGKTEELTKHFQPKSMDFVIWKYGAPISLDLQHDLHQISTVLKHDGRLIFNVSPESARNESEMREIQNKIKKAGFETICIIKTVFRWYEREIGARAPRLVEEQSKAFYLKKVFW